MLPSPPTPLGKPDHHPVTATVDEAHAPSAVSVCRGAGRRTRWLCGLLLASAIGLAACGGSPARPDPVDAERAVTVSLSSLPFAELEIPPHSRPGGAEPAERIPLDGPWGYAGTTSSGHHRWAMDVPIRPRSLFFGSAQPGMVVRDANGEEIRYSTRGEGAVSWAYNRRKLYLIFPQKGEPPKADAYTFSYPRALDRERNLNLRMSGTEDPAAFVWTEVQEDWDARSGLLLPAPGAAAWELEVPPAAELLMTPGLVRPEVLDGPPSDGARLRVEVHPADGPPTEVWQADLQPGTFEPARIDLSRWSGQQVRLRMISEARGTPDFDYVFAGEPVVASRSRDPRRVVLIFIDTLRPDHLGLYGYERDTSPRLDAWAEGAVVFEQARSVAPWTLPSARTVVTGRQPEYYAASQTLQARLAGEGFATAMFAGNVYLSANFDMHRDWGLHRVGLFPSAEEVTNDALAWLEIHEGRDALVHVHYMDPHLPYQEPSAYRHLFAGEPEGGLGEEFHLNQVRRANTRKPEVRQYIKDRYDNNIRYATDQVARILSVLDEDDIVVVYSDHGEEFWEHGGFEHGHTLFDELLRVPLLLRGPGLGAARVQAPVSLLDVTPTVLDLVGLESDGLDGTSLVPVARADAGAAERLSNRDQAFGRPLYGNERWGVLHGGTDKWTTYEGREALYRVLEDPAEKNNLIANMDGRHGAPYRAHLADALGHPVEVGYRLAGLRARNRPDHDTVAVMKVPGGVKHAFVAHDPLLSSSAEVCVQGEDTVVARWHAGYRGGRDIYVIPTKPLEEVTRDLEVTVTTGDEEDTFRVHPEREPGLSAVRTPLGRSRGSIRTVALSFAITPVFDASAMGVGADDPEVTAMLQAMGYAVGEDDDGQRPPEVQVREGCSP